MFTFQIIARKVYFYSKWIVVFTITDRRRTNRICMKHASDPMLMLSALLPNFTNKTKNWIVLIIWKDTAIYGFYRLFFFYLIRSCRYQIFFLLRFPKCGNDFTKGKSAHNLEHDSMFFVYPLRHYSMCSIKISWRLFNFPLLHTMNNERAYFF